MCPKNASYYGNRAATLMMLCRYREALEDSQQAVRLDNTFVKVSYILLKWKSTFFSHVLIFSPRDLASFRELEIESYNYTVPI